MKQQLILLYLLFFFLSCEKEAIDKSIIIALDPFDHIELVDAFEIFLTEGNDYSVEIVGDEKVIELVEFSIENNILFVENDRRLGWASPRTTKTRIYLTSPSLKRITAAGGCNIQTLSPIRSEEFGLVLTGKANQATLELDANTFFYWNDFPAGGKLTLSGKVEELKIWNFAIMSVDAKNLLARQAVIENGSKGDCQMTVSDKFEYTISGAGDIHLYGEPLEVISNGMSSSGRLIRH